MKLIGFCIAMALVAGQAQAQRVSQVTGGQLMGICNSHSPACDAYLADAIAVLPTTPKMACIPPGVTGTQLRQAFTSFMYAHKADGLKRAADLVPHILHAAYPCGGF